MHTPQTLYQTVYQTLRSRVGNRRGMATKIQVFGDLTVYVNVSFAYSNISASMSAVLVHLGEDKWRFSDNRNTREVDSFNQAVNLVSSSLATKLRAMRSRFGGHGSL